MYYLKAFLNSFYNFAWIRAQADNGKKAANYIVLFILLLSVATAVFMSYTVPKELKGVRDELLNQVPDFSAEMKDHKLTVNDLEQPYEFEEGEFFMRIDTTASSTDFDFASVMKEKNKNAFYFTSTSLFVYDSQEKGVNSISYSKVPDKIFDKETLIFDSNVYLENRKLFFGLFLLMSFVGYSVFKLLNLLLISLIVWTVNKNSQVYDKFSFGQVFTLGLFSLTLPSVVVMILRFFNYNISFLYSILLFVVLVIVTSTELIKKKEGEESEGSKYITKDIEEA